jgi:rare lipoprotein A
MVNVADKKNYINVLFIMMFMVLLSSCSHMGRRDGPPNFYVDETKIPNAVPKPECPSKYGNMRVYRVNGKNYYPLRSSKHFSQVGVASWYGTQFHAQRTSSGERYNMLAMTAAHKTLPLPTYVQVTNLKNRRTIIVKVNDRGPFKSNRIIDLSYVAAKKLGMLGRGTATVRVTAIDPYRYKPKTKKRYGV